MSDYVFTPDDIKTFEPKDLDGKTLRMVYTEDGSVGVLFGVDEEEKKIYVLVEVIKDENTVTRSIRKL
jgi:hypothetical protein